MYSFLRDYFVHFGESAFPFSPVSEMVRPKDPSVGVTALAPVLQFPFDLHVSAQPQRFNPSEPISGGPDSLKMIIYSSGQRLLADMIIRLATPLIFFSGTP